MKKIQVKVLASPSYPVEMVNLAAKLTQHSITSMEDLIDVLEAKASEKLVTAIQDMHHASVTRHGVYTLAIVGASRRFLAQIRTHHVGIDFTSGSLQYQDMSGSFDMVVPYAVYKLCAKYETVEPLEVYKDMCKQSFDNYRSLIADGIDNDAAGYVSCQASRNVLLITANAEAWRNLINRRSCNRNTGETQYVALLIWKALLGTLGGETMFAKCGPDCSTSDCHEGKMCCNSRILCNDPQVIIDNLFPLLTRGKY